MSAYTNNNLLAQARDDDDDRMQYSHLSDFESRLDIQQHPASSSQIHPHQHPLPLFTRQGNMNSNPNLKRSLGPQFITSHHSVYHSPSPFVAVEDQIHPPNQESSHGWPPYDPSVPHNFSHLSNRLNSSSFAPGGYPSSSPFPAARLSPPPIHIPLNFKGQGHGTGLTLNTSSSSSSHLRPTLAGSLDPSTGIFYRTPEHPRLRTAQACEKCRTRKAKCSGEHPSCKRCITRGLICEYAKEGRVRGPNKPKPSKAGLTMASTTKKNASNPSNSSAKVTAPGNHDSGTSSQSRNRAMSDHSSSGSSEHHPESIPSPVSIRSALLHSGTEGSAHSLSPISPFPTITRIDNIIGHRHIRRNSLSLSGHRSSRPRPPDLHLDASSHLFRLSGGDVARSATSEVSSDMGDMYRSSFHQGPHGGQLDMSQTYQFETSETTYAPGADDDGPFEHHPDFLSQVDQTQMHQFQRNYLSGTQRSGLVSSHSDRYGVDTMVSQHSETSLTAGHHSQTQGLLDLNNVQMDAELNGHVGAPEDRFQYPMPETYLLQQQHGHREQRFQQRSFERSGSGKGLGEDTSLTSAYTSMPTLPHTPSSSSCLSSPHTSMSRGIGEGGTGTVDSPIGYSMLGPGSDATRQYQQPHEYPRHVLEAHGEMITGVQGDMDSSRLYSTNIQEFAEKGRGDGRRGDDGALGNGR